MAEGVRFEPTRERNPLPVFKTGALNHSATLPRMLYQLLSRRWSRTNENKRPQLPPDCHPNATQIAAVRFRLVPEMYSSVQQGGHSCVDRCRALVVPFSEQMRVNPQGDRWRRMAQAMAD